MFCQNCGSELKENSKFCSNCGASLNSIEKIKVDNKSKKSLIIGSLFLTIFVIVLSVPFGVDKFVDTKISDFNKEYKSIGLELNVKTKSGYFITDRSVELKVANGRYFANEILDNLKKLKKENLTLLINQLKELDIDWDTFLSGTTFSGNLITNNYYFVDKPKLQLNLSSLSHQLMYEINSNKDASKILLPIFDRKILGFKFDLDFNANIEKVQLKDIDETIIDKNDRLVFQLIDNTYDKQNLSVGKLYFNFKNSDENLVLQFDRINSMFAQNNNLKFNIKDISLRTDKFTFTAKNLDSGHDYKSFNNKLEFNENFSLENIQINSKELPISLEKASYALKLSDLDEIQLNTLAQDYRNSMGDINNYTEYEIGNFFKFINEGLKLKIDINVQNLKVDKIKSGQYTFNTNLKITKNDLNQYNISLDKVLNTLESIDGGEYTFLDLYIDEDSGKSIIESGKEFKNIFEKLGFLKDKKYSFQFWRKNGKIVFNNLELGSVAEILGDNHFEKENYSSAINFYKFAVENGDFYANYRLAYSYNKLENFDLAIKYYNNFIDALDTSKLENTKQDKALSMNQIADVYRWGKEDYKNAIIWYLKAIENEYKYPDYFGLAYSYDMLEDYINAEKWYIKSFEMQKEPIAMWNLGLIYEFGKGKVEKNYEKAFKSYLDAANLNYKDAMKKISYMYEYGVGTKKDIIKTNFWNEKINKTETQLESNNFYTVNINDLVLNITNSTGEEKLMKLSLSLKSTEPTIEEIVEKYKPDIVDTVISQVNARTSEELLTFEGKELLKEELLADINNLINDVTSKNKDNVKQILFTTFVIK